jgi:hypothetical protein
MGEDLLAGLPVILGKEALTVLETFGACQIGDRQGL